MLNKIKYKYKKFSEKTDNKSSVFSFMKSDILAEIPKNRNLERGEIMQTCQ